MRLALKIAGVAALTIGFAALVRWLAHACGPRSVVFAFLLVWTIMCWVTVVLRAFPVRFPDRYYHLRPAERDGRLYEMLGMRVAKGLLRRGPLRIFNPKLRLPPVSDAQSLAKLDAAMRNAETNHVIMFVIVLPVIVHAVLSGWWDAAAWTLLFNVLINAYPVMLQRYNRGRLAARYGG